MGAATLFLAAGHGGSDKGNTGAGYVERDELIGIVGEMRIWFQLRGVQQGLGGVVFLDDDLDLVGELGVLQRWKLNEPDGDLAVDVHLDWKSGATGALVLYDETMISKRFAEAFLPAWCRATGIKNRGVYRSSTVAGQWRGWSDYGFCAPLGRGISCAVANNAGL